MASILTVSLRFQDEIGMREVRELNEGQIPRIVKILHVLGSARKIGFAPIPLEGEYDALEEVPLPAIVQVRRDDTDIFLVLQRFTPDAVVVLDPLSGPETLSRAEFEREWSGDVIVIEPDPAASERVLDELRELRRIGPKLGYTGLVVALPLLVGVIASWRWPETGGPQLGASICLASLIMAYEASIWLLFFGAHCKICSRVKVITGGLPLEWVGSIGYAVLPTVLAFHGPDTWSVALVAGAAGGHIYLMHALWRKAVACKACLVAGGCVLLAAATGIWAAAAPLLIVAILLGVLTMAAVVRLSVGRVNGRSVRLGWAVVDTLEEPTPGHARAVVYKRHGCGSCVLYETALQPALEQEFGDAIEFEPRYEDGQLLHPPVLCIAGGGGVRIVSLGLGETGGEIDRLRAIFTHALAPNSSTAAKLRDHEHVYVRTIETGRNDPSER